MDSVIAAKNPVRNSPSAPATEGFFENFQVLFQILFKGICPHTDSSSIVSAPTTAEWTELGICHLIAEDTVTSFRDFGSEKWWTSLRRSTKTVYIHDRTGRREGVITEYEESMSIFVSQQYSMWCSQWIKTCAECDKILLILQFSFIALDATEFLRWFVQKCPS